MANEPSLKINDIFDIDDYLDELEGKEPEVHSGTLRKEELDDINDRAIELVPEYNPKTPGLNIHNLVNLKENTIGYDPEPSGDTFKAELMYIKNGTLLNDLGIKNNVELVEDKWEYLPVYDGYVPLDDVKFIISNDTDSVTLTGDLIYVYKKETADGDKYITSIATDNPNIPEKFLEITQDGIFGLTYNLSFPGGILKQGDKLNEAGSVTFIYGNDIDSKTPYIADIDLDLRDTTLFTLSHVSGEQGEYDMYDTPKEAGAGADLAARIQNQIMEAYSKSTESHTEKLLVRLYTDSKPTIFIAVCDGEYTIHNEDPGIPVINIITEGLESGVITLSVKMLVKELVEQ